MRKHLSHNAQGPHDANGTVASKQNSVQSNRTQERYHQMVRRIRDYIIQGDAIQVVSSQRLARPTAAPPFDIYRALRVINPSPFMFYVQSPATTLVGASPEILCRLEGRTVYTRPLAGTRARGRTEAQDLALAKVLLADPKERAEPCTHVAWWPHAL